MSDVSESRDTGHDDDQAAGTDAGHKSFRLDGQREEALAAAQAAVRAGRCIVLPTDTVYGIGADAFDAAAVKRLLEAKHRGRDMPPPVLIAEPAMLPALAAYVPLNARTMIGKYWPGALTLIVRAQSSLRMDLGDTEGTIAVRVPDDDAARELLRHTGPLAVSSANISGSPSATTVAEAEAMLGDSVEVYLDGGPTPGPVASTIVDFTQNPSGRILRKGIIGFDELLELSPGLEDLPEVTPEPTDAVGEQAVPADGVIEVPEGFEDEPASTPEQSPDPAGPDPAAGDMPAVPADNGEA